MVDALPRRNPALIYVGAALLSLIAIYVIALDQGYLLSLVQGNAAFEMNFIHELVHDARHAAGFPCH
jgi:cobalt transporter subunit CbtB